MLRKEHAEIKKIDNSLPETSLTVSFHYLIALNSLKIFNKKDFN